MSSLQTIYYKGYKFTFMPDTGKVWVDKVGKTLSISEAKKVVDAIISRSLANASKEKA